MSTLDDISVSKGRLSILRCMLVGGIVLGVLFAFCWLGAAIGWVDTSHMYVALFTIAPVPSLAALAIGLCWSIVFGAFTGTLIAFSYNALAFLERGVHAAVRDDRARDAVANANRKHFPR